MRDDLTVVLTTHEDWLVNVLLSDGRVYTFQTEMWYEHGNSSNWCEVLPVARERALDCAERNMQPFVAECDAANETELQTALDAACMAMDDQTFRKVVRS